MVFLRSESDLAVNLRKILRATQYDNLLKYKGISYVNTSKAKSRFDTFTQVHPGPPDDRYARK